MLLHEVIFCATASPSTSSGSGSVNLHDLSTGASLASFKQTNAAPHCTAFLNSRNTQGGFLLAAQPDKSLIHAYNFQKDQISLKIVLPEKLSAVALDPFGDYFAGGTSQGRIYLWEISSGILFNSWDAHYRQINVLRFTQDGAVLISGSDDSGVSVWSMSRLLDEESQNISSLPYFTLIDHTLPVTDILCGTGAFPECRVLTSSIDHSVKLWDLSSRMLLTTFMFPQSISCLAWESSERIFFAASSSEDGSVYQMNLFRQLEDKTKGSTVEAVGGGEANNIIRVLEDSTGSQRRRLINVGHPISCISMSLASNLLVGTSSGLIFIYDSPTHQLIRTISTHKGLSISYLATLLKPIDLIGHASLSLSSTITTIDTIPVKPIIPFQRMRDSKIREMHEVSIMLPTQSHEYQDESKIYSREELLRDHAYFSAPSDSGTRPNDTTVLQSRVSELEAEVGLLRSQLGQAKGVNDQMWETVVHKVIHGSGEIGDERRRKRGRPNSSMDIYP